MPRSARTSETLAYSSKLGSPDMSPRLPRIKAEVEDRGDINSSSIWPMAFRLPMQLETLTPATLEHMSFTKTWRGLLILEGIPMADGGTRHELYVTAAETNGECRFDLWPATFVVNVTAGNQCLHDVKLWARSVEANLAMAMLMPDRLSDPAQHARNKAIFRTFCEVLTEHQIVATMPWDAPDRIPGAGSIIYPGSSSMALSVISMLTAPFPDFVTTPHMVTHLPGTSPYTLQDRQYTRFQQPNNYMQQHASSNQWPMPRGPYAS